MEINLSKRLRHLPMVHNERMDSAYSAALKNFGENGVIALTIGDPDRRPRSSIVRAASRTAADDSHYGYVIPAYGSRKLLKAAGEFRKRVSGIDLDWNHQRTITHGARKGLFDVISAVTDPDDIVMQPGMQYPGCRNATVMAYCKPAYYSVRPNTDPFEEMVSCYERSHEEHGRYPKVAVIVPIGNPYGKALPYDFFPKAIEFASANNLILFCDEAYLYTVFGGKKAFSLMQFEGGEEVGVSMYTLSKISNTPSLRLAIVEGNEEIVDATRRVVSALEYGPARWVQEAAINAFDPEGDEFPTLCSARYEERHEIVTCIAKGFGLEVWPVDGGMFAALVIPSEWQQLGSREVAARCLEETGVRVNAGIDHGEEADDILRIALVRDNEVMRKGMQRLCEYLSNSPNLVQVPEDASSGYIV